MLGRPGSMVYLLRVLQSCENEPGSLYNYILNQFPPGNPLRIRGGGVGGWGGAGRAAHLLCFIPPHRSSWVRPCCACSLRAFITSSSTSVLEILRLRGASFSAKTGQGTSRMQKHANQSALCRQGAEAIAAQGDQAGQALPSSPPHEFVLGTIRWFPD